MGEDLFWAIRGGHGASFGVVISWKIKLVDVPPIVTVFVVPRTLEQNATKIIQKWQNVANKLQKDLLIGLIITSPNSITSRRTVQVSFDCLFLGRADQLLKLVQENLPELGLKREDCVEMSWIESTLYNAGFRNGESIDVLLNRTTTFRSFIKGKSDYVRKPLPEKVWEGLFQRLNEEDPDSTVLLIRPYGGRMDEIPESEIPFPHRAGNIFKLSYAVSWIDESVEISQKHISWIRNLYNYTAPYVSQDPRAAYVNYRDLDIGTNDRSYSVKQARVWGEKYFKNNFDRLVRVKTMVDPTNFFRYEQSIPPFS